MKRLYQSLLLAATTLTLAVAAASAADYEGMTLVQVKSFTNGEPGVYSSQAAATAYSNVTNFLGQAFANGGAALQSGNTITRLAADDLTPLGVYGGQSVLGFTFSVANLGSATITARPRVRFYQSDGTGSGPGTVITGFSFNPIAFPVGVGLYNATLTAGQLLLPNTKFWAGITFDNNTGATGATAADLNNLGQGIFDPPTVGTSADQFFVTTAAGSFLANAPAGSLSSFSGNPIANFGWSFTVDAPVPTQNSTWGQLKTLYR